MTAQKWGGVASLAQAAIMVSIPLIYIVALPASTGLTAEQLGDPANARDLLLNPFLDLGDILFGHVWGVASILIALGLYERLKDASPGPARLMLVTMVISGAFFIAGGTVQYIGRHALSRLPDDPALFDMIYRHHTMLTPSFTSTGRFLLGCGLFALAYAGWTTRLLPRVLCVLFVLSGLPALLGFAVPGVGELVLLFGLPANIWQGILMLRSS